MPEGQQVKGAAFETKLAYVRRHFGEEAEAAIKARFEGKGLFPILAGLWYPATLYEEVHRLIAEEHLEGDLARLADVGIESAQSALEGVYWAFSRSRDVQALLDRLPVFHKRIYKLGTLHVEGRSGDTEIGLRLSGAPVYHEASMIQAAGFFTGIFRHVGHPDAVCELQRVDDEVRFSLRLAPKAEERPGSSPGGGGG